MSSQNNLIKKIINNFEILFEWSKIGDWYISHYIFDSVLEYLRTLFNNNNPENLEFWNNFISEDNLVKGLNNLNLSLFEVTYFRYIIASTFHSVIYNNEQLENKSIEFSRPEIYIVNGVNLRIILIEELELDVHKVEKLSDGFYYVKQNIEKNFSMTLKDLQVTFKPFFLKTTNKDKYALIKKVEYLIENNWFLKNLNKYDIDSKISLINGNEDTKLIFIQFRKWLNSRNHNPPTKRIPIKNLKRGFRIIESFKNKIDQICDLLVPDYIIHTNKLQSIKVFNDIFSISQTNIKSPLNIKKKNIWLVPYIVNSLNKLKAFSYPELNEHWEVFERCFTLDGNTYSLNQTRKFKIPSSRRAQTLKERVDSILNS
ncbi:MAG: hypothetical protein ABIO44_07705 [Saprospiraceae bacterium]